MHITQIDIDWLPPLEGVVFDFDERVNLFVGSNASGKSTILRAIKMLHSIAIGEASPPPIGSDTGCFTKRTLDDESHGDVNLRYGSINGERALLIMTASDDWPRISSGAVWSSVPFLHIPATRINLYGMNIFGQAIEEAEDADRDAPVKQLFDTASGVFNGRLVDVAIDRLVEQRSSGDRQLRKAMQRGYSCARAICAEVIYDSAPHSYVESQRGVLGNEEIVAVYHNLGIGTSDDYEGIRQPLYAGGLSSGTQGTLLWLLALTLKMASHYSWTEGWEKKPAILLIDEIENHLHPTWQRRVIPALLEHFPGLQIFATTHSPFVVAGLKAGQVHLLKRDENGVVTATTHPEDIVGWTADEILRNLMGVDDPTDDETAAAARDLRELRSEGPRDDPDAEAERQQRMLELRQRVDRDLLAGGPWKRQRELFEEEFAEALQKYRQSRDLGQENG